MTCACMLRLFWVERCADGAPWAPWMCDDVGGGWRVCERRAWVDGMIVVCVTFAWNAWQVEDCKIGLIWMELFIRCCWEVELVWRFIPDMVIRG